MRCSSLKDGFINVLLLFVIAPSEGVDSSLSPRQNSVVGMPVAFRGFPAGSKNLLQDLDSFPEDTHSQRKLHRIVKKQMAVPDRRQRKRCKRSAVIMIPNFGRGAARGAAGKTSSKAVGSIIIATVGEMAAGNEKNDPGGGIDTGYRQTSENADRGMGSGAVGGIMIKAFGGMLNNENRKTAVNTDRGIITGDAGEVAKSADKKMDANAERGLDNGAVGETANSAAVNNKDRVADDIKKLAQGATQAAAAENEEKTAPAVGERANPAVAGKKTNIDVDKELRSDAVRGSINGMHKKVNVAGVKRTNNGAVREVFISANKKIDINGGGGKYRGAVGELFNSVHRKVDISGNGGLKKVERLFNSAVRDLFPNADRKMGMNEGHKGLNTVADGGLFNSADKKTDADADREMTNGGVEGFFDHAVGEMFKSAVGDFFNRAVGELLDNADKKMGIFADRGMDNSAAEELFNNADKKTDTNADSGTADNADKETTNAAVEELNDNADKKTDANADSGTADNADKETTNAAVEELDDNADKKTDTNADKELTNSDVERLFKAVGGLLNSPDRKTDITSNREMAGDSDRGMNNGGAVQGLPDSEDKAGDVKSDREMVEAPDGAKSKEAVQEMLRNISPKCYVVTVAKILDPEKADGGDRKTGISADGRIPDGAAGALIIDPNKKADDKADRETEDVADGMTNDAVGGGLLNNAAGTRTSVHADRVMTGDPVGRLFSTVAKKNYMNIGAKMSSDTLKELFSQAAKVLDFNDVNAAAGLPNGAVGTLLTNEPRKMKLNAHIRVPSAVGGGLFIKGAKVLDINPVGGMPNDAVGGLLNTAARRINVNSRIRFPNCAFGGWFNNGPKKTNKYPHIGVHPGLPVGGSAHRPMGKISHRPEGGMAGGSAGKMPNGGMGGMPNNAGGKMPNGGTGGMPNDGAGKMPKGGTGGMPFDAVGGMPNNAVGGMFNNEAKGFNVNAMGGVPNGAVGGMPNNAVGGPFNYEAKGFNFNGMPSNAVGGMPNGAVGGMFNNEAKGFNFNGMPSNAVAGMPNGAVGGMPNGAVGGMPNGAFGGMPNGAVGGMPNNAVGGMPNGAVGGMPNGAVGGMPNNAVGGMFNNEAKGFNFNGMPSNAVGEVFNNDPKGFNFNAMEGMPSNAVGGLFNKGANVFNINSVEGMPKGAVAPLERLFNSAGQKININAIIGLPNAAAVAGLLNNGATILDINTMGSIPNGAVGGFYNSAARKTNLNADKDIPDSAIGVLFNNENKATDIKPYSEKPDDADEGGTTVDAVGTLLTNAVKLMDMIAANNAVGGAANDADKKINPDSDMGMPYGAVGELSSNALGEPLKKTNTDADRAKDNGAIAGILIGPGLGTTDDGIDKGKTSDAVGETGLKIGNVPAAAAVDRLSDGAFNGFKNFKYDDGQEKNEEYVSGFTKLKSEFMDTLIKRLKEFATTAERYIPEKDFLFGRKSHSDSGKSKETTCGEAKETHTSLHDKIFFKLPDNNDIHCYYEFEGMPYGIMKLKHKQCPRGEFFSQNQMKCLKMYYWRPLRRKKRTAYLMLNPKKLDLPEPNPEDQEPSNEWLDATQGGATQKIPPEFKPKRKPMLKIYHLRVRRKLEEVLLRGKEARRRRRRKRHALNNLGKKSMKSQRRPAKASKGVIKRHGFTRRHHPRSFLIRINKKEGKHNQDSITENDENESDGDNEEGDEEDDDDDDAEEDQEDPEEDEDVEEGEDKPPEKLSRKDTIKEFFKSAKAAVTNRAKFTEPTFPPTVSTTKDISGIKPDKVDDLAAKPKQVLLDANIKVDSAFSSALKHMLKSKQKDNRDNPMTANEGLISDRGSQDLMDPELLRMYQHLIRNNPRVKRNSLANSAQKRN